MSWVSLPKQRAALEFDGRRSTAGTRPMMTFINVLLPAPLAPTKHHQFSAPDVQGDALECHRPFRSDALISRTESRLIAVSQIRRDDRRIALDDARRPGGDDAAGAQYGDDIGNLHDQPDVMLDQQDGDPPVAWIRRISALSSSNLERIHAGGGFIEKQQARLARERARNLEPTLIAEGQLIGLHVPLARTCRRSRASRAPCRAPRRSAAADAKERRRIAEHSAIDAGVTSRS